MIEDGERMEAPLGMPEKVRQLQLACWDKLASRRPAFDAVLQTLQAALSAAQEAPINDSEDDFDDDEADLF